MKKFLSLLVLLALAASSVSAGEGLNGPSTGGSSGVSSLNSQTGAVNLTSTGNTVTITPSGGNIDLEAVTGGGGTVTTFSAGNLSPLFNTSVSNASTTPALSFSPISQTANYFYAAPVGTAGTPIFRLIVASDIPTLNQNTTGSAATLATARTIAGTSFNGSANISLANKFIVQGTSDAGLSGPQFLGALGTGLVKNTTSTGVLSIATSGTDYQAPITLTTTGTSGAATFSGNTLNIPQYSGGGGGTIINNITGNLPTAISGSSTTAAVTISSGQASDSTIAAELIGAGYSWAVSNGNAANGYQGGTTLPNSSTINFFLCNGGSGTTSFAALQVGTTSTTAPTCPTGYATYYRRLFSLTTNGSGALNGVTALEDSGGALRLYLSTQTMDVNTTVGTTASLFTLASIPVGNKFEVLGRFVNTTNTALVLWTSPDETDVAPASSIAAPGWDDAGLTTGNSWLPLRMTTSTAGQIRARASAASTAVAEVTRGWIDFRRN